MLHVHAVNTSGSHASARRKFGYSHFCAQCGCLIENKKNCVAAHAVSYSKPCCSPRTGVLTLVTTCRSCNSAQQVSSQREKCCVPKARFYVFFPSSLDSRSLPPELEDVKMCWCYRYKAEKVERGRSKGPTRGRNKAAASNAMERV